jgi:hypothetical protein
VLVAVFAAGGSVDSPETFSSGFAAAMSVAALLSLFGAVAGLWLPARPGPALTEVPRTA